MKTTILNFLTFGLMLFILGAQNLLSGSWSVSDTTPVNENKEVKDQ